MPIRVLISGAGIAGLSLALYLRRRGHEPVLVERALSLRDQGYMIDFFGPGYRVAELSGLLGRLHELHYPVARMTFLAQDGHERFSLSYDRLRALANGRVFNLLRGDLEHALSSMLEGAVPLYFGTEVRKIEDAGDRIRVELSGGRIEEADLLVGADGLHSAVRRLAFGPDEGFVRYLGYHTAAAILDRPEGLAGLNDTFFTMALPGRQAVVYPIRNGRIATFFVHKAPRPPEDTSRAAAQQELERIYSDLGWIFPELLRQQRDAEALYFDGVSQVIMGSWTRGRIALLGDSAWCVSLLAGQGASLAMGGAYVLAEELDRDGDVPAALARYERRLRPQVEKKQQSGRQFAGWFAPETRFKCGVRDLVMRMSTWKPALWLVKRQIAGSEDL